MRLSALRYDGVTSASTPVEIDVQPDGRLWVHRSADPQCFLITETVIAPRIGNIPRELRLLDGTTCIVADNDALDAALRAARLEAPDNWVHKLEREWGWAVAGLAGVVAAVALMIVFGIPAMARGIAAAVPADVDREIGEHALASLDNLLFEPSELHEGVQADLQAQFARMTQEVDGDWNFRLELRSSDSVGANAFALPSGIVIVTDELVWMAEAEEEIHAVMAHEIGHVVNRHGLRMALQNSIAGLLSLALLGDVTSSSTMVAALPTLLVNAKHSREFETEADEYAYAWLDGKGIARTHFTEMLERLEAEAGEDDGGALAYFSSHPRTEERAR